MFVGVEPYGALYTTFQFFCRYGALWSPIHKQIVVGMEPYGALYTTFQHFNQKVIRKVFQKVIQKVTQKVTQKVIQKVTQKVTQKSVSKGDQICNRKCCETGSSKKWPKFFLD